MAKYGVLVTFLLVLCGNVVIKKARHCCPAFGYSILKSTINALNGLGCKPLNIAGYCPAQVCPSARRYILRGLILL